MQNGICIYMIYVANNNNSSRYDSYANDNANADTHEDNSDSESIISDEKDGPNGDSEGKVAADIKPKGEDKGEIPIVDEKETTKNKDEHEVKGQGRCHG